MIVLTWTVLLLFLGMSIDYGIILRYRRAMQNACDSGALAGAQNLKSNPGTAAPTATTFASNDLKQNNIAPDNGTPTAITLDSNNQPNGLTPDRVRVNIHATVPTYLYRLVTNNVPVAIECAARIEPVSSVRGLVPVGLDYNKWISYYNTNIANGPCDIGIPISQRPAYCTSITNMSDLVGTWGPGNAGLLCLPPVANTTCGASEWQNEFSNGSVGLYCADPNRVTTVPDPSGPGCSLANTKPGQQVGQVKQGEANRCSSPAPPASQRQILIVPLINSSQPLQGRTSVQIWGFAAFQLDCSKSNGKQIVGSFVTIVTYQARGCDPTTDPNCISTGVDTVVLIE